ncbi:hypothetical protein BY458DRAFT_501374 [Sporodiniella umbellata]|nr:hypothetical protein BY458DRAFT_501374 [Sporodiniella umbellata]
MSLLNFFSASCIPSVLFSAFKRWCYSALLLSFWTEITVKHQRSYFHSRRNLLLLDYIGSTHNFLLALYTKYDLTKDG